ncbi:MAG TPA: heat-inducible transcriptional repressor HrcA [Candidatus Binataceae bacterium]|jgi:heat-inducible transcriptional repressor|nr:heat-inducible transcriptional repressor HrcA [Candidatus Binataceae bacterium]
MENGAKDLTRRQHALLLATVQEFIATAAPVGSQQVAQRHRLGVRAAMVRNLMSELEDAGYLTQPHTSAGRVPTEKAYRYFVDHLAPTIPFRERARIELHYSAPSNDVNLMVREASRLLALMTNQTAIATAPRLEVLMIERVQFTRLREREVLAMFITKANGIHNRLVVADRDYSQAELDRMAAYLAETLVGRTLEQARVWLEERLREERARYDQFVRGALLLGNVMIALDAQAEVYVEGSTRALDQPEFTDRARLRELLRALDDKTALLDLLDRSLKDTSLLVSIGSENSDARLAGFSVVAAPYASGSQPLGSVAIVGPLRMDYERVIPLVSYTAKALSRVLDH